MRIILALATVAALATFAAPRADAANMPQQTGWCAVGDSQSCGYFSLQQCLDDANGLQAFCEPDYSANDQSQPRIIHHRHRNS
jgi:hypothetical protein